MEKVFCIVLNGYLYFTFCVGLMYIVVALACFTDKFPFLSRNVEKVWYVFWGVVALSFVCLIASVSIDCIFFH